MSTSRQQQGGLSVTTLAIASLASVAAAIVVHEVWRGGAILGAALTPVIVAVVSESLRRPVDRVTTIREERRTRTEVRPGRGPAPPPPELERPDPFGIWQEPPAGRKVQPRHLKIALVTGVAAFAIGALVLTGAELVFGGNVGGGGDRVTIIPGGGGKSDDKPTTTETEPDEDAPLTTETAPETTPEAVPQTTEPPPSTTEPPPTSTEPAPAPAPTTPPPTPAPEPEVPPGQ